MTINVTKTLVTSLVLSRLDYCNSLLAGTTVENISRLQSIQNNAARLILKQKRYAHSLPILYELHWLPVKERIQYKIALFCYKCLSGAAPNYLSTFLEIYHPGRNLRSSSDKTIFKVPKMKYKSCGERSFAYIGPKVWNALPSPLRSEGNIDTFKKNLKHYLFLTAHQ